MNLTQNLEKTLRELKEYVSLPIVNNRDIAGIIQAFEFTYEQSWKTIQKIAGIQGAIIGNPKTAFAYALQNGWIDSGAEPIWLQAIRDRNMTSHTYREEYAHEVLQRIQKSYIHQFDHLLTELKKQDGPTR